MINLVVIENDIKINKEIIDYIKMLVLLDNNKLKLTLTTNSLNEVLNYCKNSRNIYTIYIYLSDNVNLNFLIELRQLDPLGNIIVIYKEENYNVFFEKKLELLDVINSNSKEVTIRIKDAVKYTINFRESIVNQERLIIRKCDDEIVVFDIDNIMFFESSLTKHKIWIQTYNRKYEIYGSLKAKIKLSDYFFYCHKSFVVNVRNIRSFNKKTREIIMKDDSVCLLSSKKANELYDKLSTLGL
jgi:two-component system response regulator AgrA